MIRPDQELARPIADNLFEFGSLPPRPQPPPLEEEAKLEPLIVPEQRQSLPSPAEEEVKEAPEPAPVQQ